jgi:hypothetical protein
MRLQEIIQESTVAGGIATVAVPLGATQRRGPVGQGVYEQQPVYNQRQVIKFVDWVQSQGDRYKNFTTNPEIYKKAKAAYEKSRKTIKENIDGEYNDESGMAKTNLHTMLRAVKGLHDAIADGENLPEWVQEKIAGAKMNLVSVWDYILSQHEQGIQPMQESKKDL